MANSTRSFLTNGPIAGDPGDITAGSAYRVIWREIGRAISDASEKRDDNSKKIIDELKALRSHLKDEAEKSPNKRISQLPPDVAREFLDVSRSIKDIASRSGVDSGAPSSSYDRLNRSHHHRHGGVVNAAFEGRGPIGGAAVIGADALVPGMGIVVKAVQENSHLVRDTFHALGQLPGLFHDSLKFTLNTFTAIHNFLNPNHPFGLVNALSKLFGGKGGGGGGGILSYLMSTVTNFVIRRFLPLIVRSFIAAVVIGSSLIVAYLIKKYFGRDTTGWPKVADPGIKMPGTLPGFLADDGNSLFTLKLDPEKWGWLLRLLGKDNKDNSGGSGSTRSFLNPTGGVVPGGSVTQTSFDLNTRSIKSPEGFNEGFNFNTGIAGDESDTIIQLMFKQTQLLGEILRALLSGRSGGQGFIRALQAGGTVSPGETALVGEDGAERIQAGGQKGTVNGPALLTAGKDPVQVNPAKQGGGGPPGVVAGNSPATVTPLPRSRPTTGTPKGGGIYVPRYQGDPSTDPMLSKTYEPTRSTIFYTGPEGKRLKEVTYTDPTTGESYTDRTQPTTAAASHLPAETPGIAFGFHNFPRRGQETLGGYYIVTPKSGENVGQSFVLRHIDSGPNPGKGEVLDYNAPAAQMVFGSMKESKVQGGAYLRYIGADLPEGVTAGRQPSEGISDRFTLSPEHSKFVQQQQAGTPSPPTSADARITPGGQPQQNANIPVKGGGPSTTDSYRAINTLKGKQRQLQRDKQAGQQPTQQQPQQIRSRKQRSNKVAFSNVGMIALSAGSGFS